MKTTLAKLAGSSLVLGTLAIGCTPTANLHPESLATSGPKATKLAAQSAAKAQALLARHDAAKAIAPAEIAVAAAPENVGYRVMLGQAYLQAGRFASAETALGEVLTLDPTNAKAGLNLSLAQSALGHRDAAQATLARVRAGIAPADLGLALALAGQKDEAITVLAAEARGPNATPKTRQNLAFALAISGRWKEASAVAAQDVNPNELDARMRAWAEVATPKSSVDQVASVLGVSAAADPGEPTMLALGQPQVPTAVATVEPAPAPALAAMPTIDAPTPVPAAAPMVAEAPAPAAAAPVAVAQSEPDASAPPVKFFYPGEEATTFVAPSEHRTATPRVSARKGHATVKPVSLVAPKQPVPKLLARRAPSKAWPQAAGGEFVVQLGAFSRAGALQTAWANAHGGYLRMAAFTPSSMTYAGVHKGKTLYRLSIAGFKSRADADTVCLRIRAHGGKCFVRAAQGDRLAAWFKQGGTAVASRGPAPKPLKLGKTEVSIALDPAVRRTAVAMPRHSPIVIASR